MTSGHAAERACSTCGTPAGAAGRFCAMCGAVLAATPHEAALRRHVTVLFCDLAGFTRMSEGLDPEVLRIVMDRYFRLASKVIWAYGGATEKFIGDAVMAVFGMPVAREDDSVRAVSAALDVLAELSGLNAELAPEFGIELTARIGVHSGLVSATYDQGSGDFRVVGDAVNTASRIQSAAGTGQVLVSEPVAQLVHTSMSLDEVEPLILKGKQAPVRAWHVVPGSTADPLAAQGPFLGREPEMAQLRALYDRTAGTGCGSTAVLLGPPGIGKSRIVAEFRSALAGERHCVLTGRARSYGRGISYAPIAELIESGPAAWAAFESAAAGDPAAERAAACLRGLMRPPDGRERGGEHGGEIEEVAWSLRTFLASAARQGTVLVIWEDLHWAEPALLDVIEFLGDELRELPIMQICAGRPELTGKHPHLPGSAVSATLQVPPLTPEDTARLVCDLVGTAEVAGQDLDEACARIITTCEGNPLFAELMAGTAEDPAKPPPHAIAAVFAARLDCLDPADRLVLEMAAVAGRDFTSGDIQYLLAADGSDGVDMEASLERLRRARLLTGSRLSARHGFAQAFSRDTAYELTAKTVRLRWHQALAERLDRSARPADPAGPAYLPGWNAGSQVGVDLLTYHLESAALLCRELHPRSPACRETGIRAAAALAAQGIDAANRRDLRAAASLLERALAVLPRDAPGRVELELRLSDTYLGLGDADRAQLPGAAPGATAEHVVRDIQREIVALRGGRSSPRRFLAAEDALAARLAPDDDLGWCRLHQFRAHRHLIDERIGAAEADLAAALARALALGSSYEAGRIRRSAGELAMWGPAPVAQGLRRCQELAEIFAESRVLLVSILGTRGGLLGLDGDFAGAREAFAAASRFASELRMSGAEIGLAHVQGVVASVAGEHMAAAGHFGRAGGLLAAAGQAAGAALLDAYRARELVATGEPVPEKFLVLGEPDLAAIDDKRMAALTAMLCAFGAAQGGAPARVPGLVERALRACDRMEDLFFQGAMYQDAAVVLRRAALPEAAASAAATARDRYVAKGARAALPGIDALMAELPEAR